MESHIASSIVALVCLSMATGCSPLLMWNRESNDLDLAKLNERQANASDLEQESPQRLRLSDDESDPPPEPRTATAEKASPPEKTDSGEFLDQLRGSELTAEEQKTIERLMQKSPDAARFLADRAGDPTERNLAKVHEATVSPPREGEPSGIDLLREGTTMPPTRLDGAGSPPISLNEVPPQARLGAPEPLREPSAGQMLPPQMASQPAPLPIVESGPVASAGQPSFDGRPAQQAALQPPAAHSPAPYPSVSYGQQYPLYNTTHAAGAPANPYGQMPQVQQGYAPAPPGYAQSSATEVLYGQPQAPGGYRPGSHDPQMIINQHVRQPQSAERVAPASFNASYPDTATWGHADHDPTPLPGAALDDVQPNDWRRHLQAAIAALESELGAANRAGETGSSGDSALGGDQPREATPLKRQELARLDAQLRMLYLAADMREAAVMPVEHYDARQQEFWKYAMNGLSVYLDREKHPVDERRLRLALRDLRHAVAELAADSTLDVRSLAFCSQVNSFGNYEEFAEYRFAAGQEVLLYVEVENFTSAKVSGGFETSLLGSYRVFDAQKTRRADHTFIEETEVCRNHRRDYFITYRMYMPKDIAPGQYTLQLTIEDLKGNKAGQASIKFEIQ